MDPRVSPRMTGLGNQKEREEPGMISLILAAALQAVPVLTLPERKAVDCVQSAFSWMLADKMHLRQEGMIDQMVAYYMGKLSVYDSSIKWPDVLVGKSRSLGRNSSDEEFEACLRAFKYQVYPTPHPMVDPEILPQLAPPAPK